MVSEHASPLAALGGAECGGQNLHVAELSAALARAGHEVTVYTRRDDPDQQPCVDTGQGYRVVHVPAGPAAPVPRDELVPYLGEFGDFLTESWRYRPPDVVHAHFWMSGLVCALAAQRVGVPIVLTYHALGVVKRRHQGSVDTSPAQRVRVERLIGRKAATVIATCSDEVTELVRMGLPRSRVAVVPCGVDCELFTPHGPRWPRAKAQRVLSIGRLVPRKGLDDAVQAMAGVPGAELVIAGGPPYAQLDEDAEVRRLRALARDLGMADRVQFTGQVSRTHLPGLIRSADVVVCVPWYEPFGISALEAMACGRPVLAAAVGGLIDTVVHGLTGEHVPPRRPEALAAALRSLLADPLRRQAYGVAARDRTLARYTWDRVAADTLRVYENVTAGAGLRRPAAVGGA
jgi:glycosyltransferase involved in cell wall biosynthesis